MKNKEKTMEEILFLLVMIGLSILTFGVAYLVWWLLKMAIYYGVKSANK